MPIYDYQCTDCGHRAEVLRKLSDPALSTCPACGKEHFTKQVSAAGFQLKGSGWYATDFKGGASASQDASAKDVGKPAEATASACGTGGCGHAHH